MWTRADRTEDWDEAVLWIALGYNCSVQESIKMTPYQLIFARTPIIPPAAVT